MKATAEASSRPVKKRSERRALVARPFISVALRRAIGGSPPKTGKAILAWNKCILFRAIHQGLHLGRQAERTRCTSRSASGTYSAARLIASIRLHCVAVTGITERRELRTK